MIINYVRKLFKIKKKIPKEVWEEVTKDDFYMAALDWEQSYYQVTNQFYFVLPYGIIPRNDQ